MSDANQIAPPGKGIDLADLHAFCIFSFQTKFDRRRSRSQFVLPLHHGKLRLMVGQAIANQATLGNILVFPLEKHEGLALVGHRFVVIEFQTNNIPPLGRDIGHEQVGFDSHDLGRTAAFWGRGPGHRELCRRGRYSAGALRYRDRAGLRSRNRLLSRHRGMRVFLPCIPEHEQGENKDGSEDQAFIVHGRPMQIIRVGDQSHRDSTDGSERDASGPCAGL